MHSSSSSSLVPCPKALAIMSFQTALSLAAEIAVAVLSMSIHAARLSTICSLCLPLPRLPSIFPVITRCSNPFLLIMWPTNVACCFLILLTNDLVSPASSITSIFVLFAVHGIFNKTTFPLVLISSVLA